MILMQVKTIAELDHVKNVVMDVGLCTFPLKVPLVQAYP